MCLEQRTLQAAFSIRNEVRRKAVRFALYGAIAIAVSPFAFVFGFIFGFGLFKIIFPVASVLAFLGGLATLWFSVLEWRTPLMSLGLETLGKTLDEREHTAIEVERDLNSASVLQLTRTRAWAGSEWLAIAGSADLFVGRRSDVVRAVFGVKQRTLYIATRLVTHTIALPPQDAHRLLGALATACPQATLSLEAT